MAEPHTTVPYGRSAIVSVLCVIDLGASCVAAFCLFVCQCVDVCSVSSPACLLRLFLSSCLISPHNTPWTLVFCCCLFIDQFPLPLPRALFVRFFVSFLLRTLWPALRRHMNCDDRSVVFVRVVVVMHLYIVKTNGYSQLVRELRLERRPRWCCRRREFKFTEWDNATKHAATETKHKRRLQEVHSGTSRQGKKKEKEGRTTQCTDGSGRQPIQRRGKGKANRRRMLKLALVTMRCAGLSDGCRIGRTVQISTHVRQRQRQKHQQRWSCCAVDVMLTQHLEHVANKCQQNDKADQHGAPS